MPLRLRSAGGGSVLLKPPVALAADVSMEVPAYDGAKLLTNKTPGTVIQVVQSTDNSIVAYTNTNASFIEVAVLPSSTASKVLVSGSVIWSGDNPNGYFALERSIDNGAWVGIANIAGYDDMFGGTDSAMNTVVEFLDSPATTAQVRYRVFWYHITQNGGTLYKNRSFAASGLTFTAARPGRSMLIAQEIAG